MPHPIEHLLQQPEGKTLEQHFLDVQPYGKAELAKALGHSTVSGALHKQIRRLLELRLIEMTMRDKPQSRLQRYRLTEEGRQLFEQAEGKRT